MRELIANTFTPLYDEIEDRLRVVINYQDMQNRVDFMITRSFVINLIPSVDEFILKHYGEDSEVLDNIKISVEHDVEKKENLSQTDNTNLELFRTDEELLLEVNLAYDANTKNSQLTFSSKNSVAKAMLDKNMLMQVVETIKAAIPNFKWGIANNF